MSEKRDEQKPEQTEDTKPQAKAPTKVRKLREACATTRELQKYRVVRKAGKIYGDFLGSSDLTKDLAESLEDQASTLCDLVAKTRIGKKVDEWAANITGEVRKVGNKWVPWAFSEKDSYCETSGDEKKQENDKGTKNGKPKIDEAFLWKAIMLCVNLYFRFVPPCMFFRWAVHACFLTSQLLLAVCLDLARIKVVVRSVIHQCQLKSKASVPDENKERENSEPSAPAPDTSTVDTSVEAADTSAVDTSAAADNAANGDTNAAPKDTGPENTNTGPAKTKDDEKTKESNDLLQRLINFFVTGVIGKWFKGFFNASFAIFYIVDCYVLIAYLSTQTKWLAYADDILYQLAGIEESKEDVKERENVERLCEARKIHRSIWIADACFNQAVGQSLRFPVLGMLVKFVGLSQPCRPFRALSKRLRSETTKDMRELVFYLREDPTYDESMDPDYVPQEPSMEDSLEYKDDAELEKDLPTPIPHVKDDGKRRMNDFQTPMCSTPVDAPEAAKQLSGASEDVGSTQEGHGHGKACGQSEIVTDLYNASLATGLKRSDGNVFNGNVDNGTVSTGNGKEIETVFNENAEVFIENTKENHPMNNLINEKLNGNGEKAMNDDHSTKDAPNGDHSTKDAPNGDHSTKDPLNGDHSAKDPLNGDHSAKDPLNGDQLAKDTPNGDQLAKDTPNGDQLAKDTPNGDHSTKDAPNGDHSTKDPLNGDHSAKDTPNGDQLAKATPNGDNSAKDPPSGDHLAKEQPESSYKQLPSGLEINPNEPSINLSKALVDQESRPPSMAIPSIVVTPAELYEVNEPQNAPVVGHVVDERNGPSGSLFFNLSGMQRGLMVYEAVPEDSNVDPSLLDVDNVIYIRDGKEYTCPQEAGFVWDSDEDTPKSGLRPGWLKEFTESALDDSVHKDTYNEENDNELTQGKSSQEGKDSPQEGKEPPKEGNGSPREARKPSNARHSSDVDTGEVHTAPGTPRPNQCTL